MEVEKFLKEKNISLGDNVKHLLRELGLEHLLKKIEESIGESAKMSKSKENVVDPEDMLKEFGADAVRLYILFSAPPERDFEWREEGIAGAHRFLKRLYTFVVQNLKYLKGEGKDGRGDREYLRKVYKTVKKYEDDLKRNFQFNTAIASLMELFNETLKAKEEGVSPRALREGLEVLLKLLYPITPHLCEELWQKLGKGRLLAYEGFPKVKEEYLKEEEVTVVVQVNGKKRGALKVLKGTSREELIKRAKELENVKRFLEGKSLKKVIYVENKILNLVV